MSSEPRRGRSHGSLDERRLKLALEVSGVGVFEHSVPLADDTFVSARWAEILGYATDELPSARTALQWLTDEVLHPDDLPRVRRAYRGLLSGRHERLSVEARLRHRQGGVVHVRCIAGAAARDEAGRATRVTGVLLDISAEVEGQRALKEERSRLRAILDHMVDAVITTDERDAIVSANPAVERLFGYRPDELLGTGLRALLAAPPPEAPVVASDELPPEEDEPDEGSAARPIEGRAVARRKDGGRLPVDVAVSELWVGGQRLFTSIVRDVSDRTRLEEYLRRRADELLEQNRHKDEFMAVLGHELRNPLFGLRAAAEVLRVPHLPADRYERARETIVRQIDHMATLLDDLLDVARIARGELDLERHPLEVDDLVREVVDAHRQRLRQKGLALVLRSAPHPAWVEGDATRLRQVFENLLDNAIKYTSPPGSVEVSVEQLEGEHAVCVTVRDSGVGFQPDQAARLFEPFRQLGRGYGPRSGGIGIGLSLVKRIVLLHGGTIDAQSAGEGQGAAFRVRLPLRTEAPAPAPEVEEGAPVAAPNSRARRVLVVDDNVDTAQLLADLLATEGNEVEVAHRGEQAVETARAFHPDVVLCDIALDEGWTGYDVVRALRADPATADCRALALTGFGQIHDRQRALAAGFDEHLTKPVGPERLIAALHA